MNMNEKSPTINIETITPESAKLYLGMNTNNRNVCKARVIEYLEQMRRGQWRLSPDAITFDTEGILINGQHRMLALVAYGKPLLFLVGRNYPKDTFSIIDTGKNRTAGDVLQVKGVKRPKLVAAIIRRRFALKEKKVCMDGTNEHGGGYHSTRAINNQEIFEQYLKMQDLYDNILNDATAINSSSGTLVTSEIGGLLSYLVIDLGYEYDKSLFFFQEICSVKESCSKTLESIRVKLLKDKISNKRMTAQYKQGLIMRAWNYYKNGKEIGNYNFDPVRNADMWF